MHPPNYCHFPLRSDFHLEVGWRDYMRDQALTNATVVRAILENHHKLNLGHDPRSLIERWNPYALGLMLYFWIVRVGQVVPSFVATDGVFTMFLDPRPRHEHLAGLPADLFGPLMMPCPRPGHRSSSARQSFHFKSKIVGPSLTNFLTRSLSTATSMESHICGPACRL